MSFLIFWVSLCVMKSVFNHCTMELLYISTHGQCLATLNGEDPYMRKSTLHPGG